VVLVSATVALLQGSACAALGQAGGPMAPFAGNFTEHPLAAAMANVVFLAVIVGVSATVVTALFKSPFDK